MGTLPLPESPLPSEPSGLQTALKVRVFQVGLEQVVCMLRTHRAYNRTESTDLEPPSSSNVELMVGMKLETHGPGKLWQCGLEQNARLPGQVALGKSQVNFWETFSVKKERILFGNTSHMVLIRSV